MSIGDLIKQLVSEQDIRFKLELIRQLKRELRKTK